MKKEKLSNCCKAEIITYTAYCICSKCAKPCDIWSEEETIKVVECKYCDGTGDNEGIECEHCFMGSILWVPEEKQLKKML